MGENNCPIFSSWASLLGELIATLNQAIKCFDSVENGRAQFAAHTAFDDLTSSLDAPARESIELRTLVFYE